MSTTEQGRAAEQLVARHLERMGHTVLAQNWRTRSCEIDIVSQKNQTIHLVEVKYRATALWGGGVEAITSKKLAQMNYAATVWVAHNKWNGDVALMVASVSGTPPRIDDLFEV